MTPGPTFTTSEVAQIIDAAARRVDDLLEANNRYLERARTAEAEVARLLNAFDGLGFESPVRPQAATTPSAGPHCQLCGGQIQAWTCQGCDVTFSEDADGLLTIALSEIADPCA